MVTVVCEDSREIQTTNTFESPTCRARDSRSLTETSGYATPDASNGNDAP